MNREEYREYLTSERWKGKRRDAIRRAGGRCQECLATGKLHVHHTTYARVGDEWPGDLIVLCPWHHHARHYGIPRCKRCEGAVLRGLDYVPEYCLDCLVFLMARGG